MGRWILAFFLLLLAGTVSANTSQAECLDCAELLAAGEGLNDGESLLLTKGEAVILLYRAERADANEVVVCCGIQDTMVLLDEESRLWSLSYPVPRLDEAIFSYGFSEQRNREQLVWTDFRYWRGENAPPAPPSTLILQGRVQDMVFESKRLNENRGMTVYYPPNYAINQVYPVIYLADGQIVWEFARTIEALILADDIPPMLLVGVHALWQYRAEEYLPSFRSERFALHESLFTEDIRLWAEENLGASTEPSQRAVYGHSNGGVFAATMALLHPDIYGIAFPFSVGQNPFDSFPDAGIDPDLRLYFTAGTLEASFSRNTQRLSEIFAEAGAEVIFNERVAGHDFYMWGEEFYHAVKWAFGE